uniref:TIR domain-containing protein n=1 Tax=Steinernema glaseri TaxID=37863 RepID=A0A1I8AQC1_9BILA
MEKPGTMNASCANRLRNQLDGRFGTCAHHKAYYEIFITEGVEVCERLTYQGRATYNCEEMEAIPKNTSFNEAWVDLVCSMKRLCSVKIVHKLEDDAIPLFEKVVMGRKISTLVLDEEACPGVDTGLLKSLLCQFEQLELKSHDDAQRSDVIRKLLGRE